MGLLDRFRAPLTETGQTVPIAEHAALANQVEFLQESLSGLEQLAREDRGWQRLGMEQAQEFTRPGLLTIQANCVAASIKSPLIGRGLRIRRNYVWGAGVEIAGRIIKTGNGPAATQDTTVNDLVQSFIDSPEYRRTLGSSQAREERETDLGNRGEFFVLAVAGTDSIVRPRLVPQGQIVDYITDPDDTTDVWFYKRTWTTNRVNLVTGQRERLEQTEWHPVLDYRPPRGMRVPLIEGRPVRWDQPIQHCAVNTMTDACWGIPDVYAAIDWARAYAEFLSQWAVLMRSLSRYAWRATAPGAQNAKMKRSLQAGNTPDPITGEAKSGGTAIMSPDANLEAIPKSGATIDADSGKPLAGMAAAALDVPLTMLLADPGSTGARAVAETLDRPLELTTGARRNLWTDWAKALFDHMLLVAAENNRLPGARVEQRGNRQALTLADGLPATVDVTWPPIEDVTPEQRMAALKDADSLGVLPPLLIVRMALEILGWEDIDEVIDEITDDDGNFIDPEVAAAAAALSREQDGAPGSQAAEAYRAGH